MIHRVNSSVSRDAFKDARCLKVANNSEEVGRGGELESARPREYLTRK